MNPAIGWTQPNPHTTEDAIMAPMDDAPSLPGDGRALADALVATGVTIGQALAQVAAVYGREAAFCLYGDSFAARPKPTQREAVQWLHDVAEVDVGLANDLLCRALSKKMWPMDGPSGPGLILHGEWVERLPEGLAVTGHLDLSFCQALKALPDGLSVGGNLTLHQCDQLVALPDGLAVGGHVTVDKCPGLLRTGERSCVGKAMVVKECPSLAMVAPGIDVGWDLDFMDCPALAHVAGDLRVYRRLKFKDCGALVGLGTGIKVGGRFELDECHALRDLPADLDVRSMKIKACHALKALPEGCSFVGGMRLEGCPRLRRLPDGIAVGGHLTLDGGVELDAWPQGMVLGGLQIVPWPTWDGALPADLRTREVYVKSPGECRFSLDEWQRRHPAGWRR